VGIQSFYAFVFFPHVDLSVGATRHGIAVLVESDAREGGAGFGTEDTVLFVTFFTPEANMLAASSGKVLGTFGSVESQVQDLVVGAIFAPLKFTFRAVIVDFVVVVQISSSNHSTVNRDAASTHSTGAAGKLESLHLLTSAGVPEEHNGLVAILTSKNCSTALRHSKSSDIISVTIIIISNVLGSVVDFTSTEEFLLLRRTILIKNDAEGSSHIDNFAVFVHVTVLARVGTAVTQDVIKSIGLFRRRHLDRVVVVRLSDLSNPGFGGHKLFASSSILCCEEIVFRLFFVSRLSVIIRSSFLVVSRFVVRALSIKCVILFLTTVTFDVLSSRYTAHKI